MTRVAHSWRPVSLGALLTVSLLIAGCLAPTSDDDLDAPGSEKSPEPGPPDGKEVAFNLETTGLFPYLLDHPHFDPDRIEVSWGDTVTVTLHNLDLTAHDWTLEVNNTVWASTGHVDPLEQGSITFEAPEPGSYTFYCSHGDHREQGQTGVLIVHAE